MRAGERLREAGRAQGGIGVGGRQVENLSHVAGESLDEYRYGEAVSGRLVGDVGRADDRLKTYPTWMDESLDEYRYGVLRLVFERVVALDLDHRYFVANVVVIHLAHHFAD